VSLGKSNGDETHCEQIPSICALNKKCKQPKSVIYFDEIFKNLINFRNKKEI
jgi:hypothetical protein